MRTIDEAEREIDFDTKRDIGVTHECAPLRVHSVTHVGVSLGYSCFTLCKYEEVNANFVLRYEVGYVISGLFAGYRV